MRDFLGFYLGQTSATQIHKLPQRAPRILNAPQYWGSSYQQVQRKIWDPDYVSSEKELDLIKHTQCIGRNSFKRNTYSVLVGSFPLEAAIWSKVPPNTTLSKNLFGFCSSSNPQLNRRKKKTPEITLLSSSLYLNEVLQYMPSKTLERTVMTSTSHFISAAVSHRPKGLWRSLRFRLCISIHQPLISTEISKLCHEEKHIWLPKIQLLGLWAVAVRDAS